MSNVECPYCGHEQEVYQDYGHATSEGEIYEEGCGKCDKNFAMKVSIGYYFYAEKADCMNGGEHNWQVDEDPLFEGRKRRLCLDCDKSEWFTP